MLLVHVILVRNTFLLGNDFTFFPLNQNLGKTSALKLEVVLTVFFIAMKSFQKLQRQQNLKKTTTTKRKDKDEKDRA
jgi:hypothetical protein